LSNVSENIEEKHIQFIKKQELMILNEKKLKLIQKKFSI
jgi:hypothetical protein